MLPSMALGPDYITGEFFSTGKGLGPLKSQKTFKSKEKGKRYSGLPGMRASHDAKLHKDSTDLTCEERQESHVNMEKQNSVYEGWCTTALRM